MHKPREGQGSACAARAVCCRFNARHGKKQQKVFLSPNLAPKSSEHWRRTHIRADSRKFLSLPGALTRAAPSAKQQRAGLITNGCKNYHWRKKKKKKATSLMVSRNALTAALSVFNGTGCSSVSPALVALMSLSLCWQRNAPPKPRDGCRKKHPRGWRDTSTAGGNVTPTGAVCLGQDATETHGLICIFGSVTPSGC